MTIKEIKFDPSLINPDVNALSAAIKNTPVHELSTGLHDLTPKGYRDSYTVDVADPGDGNNEGVLKITRRGGREINLFRSSDHAIIREKTNRPEKIIHLKSGTPPFFLSRPLVLDNPNQSGIRVDGVVFYEPKK